LLGEDNTFQILPNVARPILDGDRLMFASDDDADGPYVWLRVWCPVEPCDGRAGDTKNVHVGVPSGPDVGDAKTSYAPPSKPACAKEGGRMCTKDVGDGGEIME
jgi:hypothetical protein